LNIQLSNIELYYSSAQNISANKIKVDGDEFSHITKVMRHSINDQLYVTNGDGKIFSGNISKINKTDLELNIENAFIFENKFKNIFFCIPKLKNNDRFEFALEKCTELGFTNYLVFDSERTISKSIRISRWNKILLSAMKQSLNSFLPSIKVLHFNDILKLEGEKIGFEQNSGNMFNISFNRELKYYLIFGPEGGLSGEELFNFEKRNIFKITDKRLRTETAVITAASIIAGNAY
jgi:16S rRNA (uracil1498-N3)-methyltransferase